jgi:diguanylate cyclase (GGDEF)-like protein
MIKSMFPSARSGRQLGMFERMCASPGMVRAAIQSLFRLDIRSLLSSITAPTLVIHARDDPMPVQFGRYLADHIPRAHLLKIEASDHAPWYTEPDRVLTAIEEFLTGSHLAPDLRPALATLREGKPFYNQVFGFDRLGAERIWLMSSCRLVNADMPGQSDMLMSFTDVTVERAAADKVMFYATHDALTKLPNRASVLRKINRALAAREEHGKLRAVLFIDIDDLKATNDTLGHTAGDEVLCSAAQCLQRVMADGDVAGRLGGDEFVVLVCRAVSRRDLDEMVERLRTELSRPTAIGPLTTPIRASVGVVEVHPTEQRTADEILRDADFAMYEAKRANRNQRR